MCPHESDTMIMKIPDQTPGGRDQHFIVAQRQNKAAAKSEKPRWFMRRIPATQKQGFLTGTEGMHVSNRSQHNEQSKIIIIN